MVFLTKTGMLQQNVRSNEHKEMQSQGDQTESFLKAHLKENTDLNCGISIKKEREGKDWNTVWKGELYRLLNNQVGTLDEKEALCSLDHRMTGNTINTLGNRLEQEENLIF